MRAFAYRERDIGSRVRFIDTFVNVYVRRTALRRT